MWATRLKKTPVGSDPTNYTWDYENRLTKVVLPANGGTVTFKYDPFGRRVQKSFSAGGTTNYVYDAANVIEELDNSGNLIARHTDSDTIDETLSTLRGGTVSYDHADGVGS